MKPDNNNIYIFIVFLILIPVSTILAYLAKKEYFAASQGGAQIQLATSHVYSEDEMRENLEYQKKQVTQDIYKMTEPELFSGPKPFTMPF